MYSKVLRNYSHAVTSIDKQCSVFSEFIPPKGLCIQGDTNIKIKNKSSFEKNHEIVLFEFQ